MRDRRNGPPEPDPWRSSAMPPEMTGASRRSPRADDPIDDERPPADGTRPVRGSVRAESSRRTLGDVPQPPSQSRQLAAMPPRGSVPAPHAARGALIRAEQARAPAISRAVPRSSRAGRRLATSAAVLVTLVVSLVVGLTHALGTSTAGADGKSAAQVTPQATGTPPPSGGLPAGVWVASAGVVVYLPPPPKPTPGATGTNDTGIDFGIQPCHDRVVFPATISQWTVPSGCYANVYVPNPANYPPRPIFGYCNWWVRENHLSNYNITMGSQIYLGTTPAPGDAIFFAGGVQGASADGHWAQVVAVAPDHYWFLLSEMNFAWRGAGFGKIDYRFAHVGPGVSFYK